MLEQHFHSAARRAAHRSSGISEEVWRARSGLGGSHTVVTYPPLDALCPLEGDEPFSIDGAAPVHLYFHVAFCEYICAFCHYQRTFTHPNRPAPASEPYVDAIGREVERRRNALDGAEIASVYLGGGTPTSLTFPLLERLVGYMRRLGDLAQTAFSFETSPKTAVEYDGAEKLALLVDAGASRVSMGVQTFDDMLLRQQRGHGSTELEAAMEQIFALGISVNIDLIQDLPLQTEEHIEADLGKVAEYRPHQVTWYTLRAQKGSTIGRLEGSHTAREAELFASIADSKASVERRLRIIRAMRELGYHSQPGGRFLRESRSQDIFKLVRNGLDTNLLGFGLSSYSHGWGYFFRNIADHKIARGIAEYIDRMRSGATPIGSIMRIDDIECTASKLVQAARRFIPYSMLERDDLDGAAWRSAATCCVEAGLFEPEAAGLRLTELGTAMEEEVSSLFYSARVRKRLAMKGDYWADDHWFERTIRVADEVQS